MQQQRHALLKQQAVLCMLTWCGVAARPGTLRLTQARDEQAFHALNEQGVPTAPLCDGDSGAIVGMISASDFIQVLQRLRTR